MTLQFMESERNEDGVAALELALMMGLLFTVLLLFYPLATTLMAKERLQQVAEETVRFASSAPNTPEFGSSNRRPSGCDIYNEVIAAAKEHGISGTVTPEFVLQDGPFTTTTPPTPVALTCTTAFDPQPGQYVLISLSYGASMGPFGGIYAAAGLTAESTRTVSASATAREE